MWLVRQPRMASPAARVVCLPYAGGGAVAYHGWAAWMPPGFELCTVELPGRGTRFTEPLLHEFESLLGALHAGIADILDERTIFFGHSLGALFAFELARRMDVPPRALIVSGCPAPHRAKERRLRSRLSDEAFMCELKTLGGTPPDVLASEELMAVMLPVLRADFAVSESYEYHAGAPLRCPVVAMGGNADDEASPEDLEAWAQLTRGGFCCRVFVGDHFFVKEHEREALRWAFESLRETERHAAVYE